MHKTIKLTSIFSYTKHLEKHYFFIIKSNENCFVNTIFSDFNSI